MKTKHEIKTGDEVKIISSHLGSLNKVGETGIVTEVKCNTSFRVKVGDKEDVQNWHSIEEVELIKSTHTLLSNELILQAHKEVCELTKLLIEKECPELFKPKFKVGDWVYDKCSDKVKKVGEHKYNEMFRNAERSCEDICLLEEYYRLATPPEIESHLISVAKEKGFKVGAKVTGLWGKQTPGYSFRIERDLKEFEYFPYADSLVFNNACIYINGKWATILPSEPIEVTIEEIAKLKGVDVSRIKIIK